ncbi:hypothetical protein DFH07DRAFT_781256 [Mycena maculata]|uniref:Uncharacterized protein n=1 Tax=Mycena maculata TaxID=230809 RepID=A0AAD7MTI8_9AGAR|nr:hypothetical protein DFH07DRAFT_781256 [Mycena maculata]
MVASLPRPSTQKDEQFFWDLTPRDTSPIEGWHAQDNQVNNTNRSLIEAIFLARQFDSDDNTRVIKALVEFGIWENGSNSTQARFSSQALHLPSTEGGNKHLKARLAAAVQLTWSRDVEIQHLRSELNSRNLIGIPMQDSGAVPSTPQRKVPAVLPTTLIDISHSPDSGIAPGSSSPVASPSKLPTLLFSGILGIQRLFLPNDSDLDYVDALRSDRMNNVFEEMGCHAVNGNVEPKPVSSHNQLYHNCQREWISTYWWPEIRLCHQARYLAPQYQTRPKAHVKLHEAVPIYQEGREGGRVRITGAANTSPHLEVINNYPLLRVAAPTISASSE